MTLQSPESDNNPGMKTKYETNELIDFLEQNPMEMRAFLDAHWELSPFTRLVTKILSYFY